VTCRSSYTHLTRLTFLRNVWVIVYSNVSSGSHPKLCSFWNRNTKLVYHSVWISMYKTYKFTDKANGSVFTILISIYDIFTTSNNYKKHFVLPNHVLQDTMYIINVFYGTICYLLRLALVLIYYWLRLRYRHFRQSCCIFTSLCFWYISIPLYTL